MIRLSALVFLMCFCVWAGSAVAQNNPASPARFFSSMQDVPVVAGLTELQDQSVTFDKPEGRIVESVAEIETGSFAGIRKLYDETLPQLGWSRIAENSYAREGEFLHLNFETYDGRNFVRVLVRPQEGIHN